MGAPAVRRQRSRYVAEGLNLGKLAATEAAADPTRTDGNQDRPGDVLRRRTAVRVVPTGVPEPEPCLIVVASAVVVRAARVDSDPGVVGGHALFEPLSSYANAYANQLGCVFGCPPMFTNRLDLQKPDTGRRRRSPFAYLGVKWSQVQILSARPVSCLGTSLTGVPRHGLHLDSVFG